ncbi:MAG: Vgb family protein [Nitrososphaerales archaeon]
MPGSRKSKRRKNLVFAIVIIAIIIGSSLFYYYRISSPQTNARPTLPAASMSTLVSSAQHSRYITEYSTKSDAATNAIAVDNKGNVWFTMGGYASLGELNPKNGTIHTYQLPETKNSTINSWGIAVDDSSGTVWFTDEISNAVWSFNASSDAFSKYQLPNPQSSPYQIALDQSGNVWFTEIDGGRLGEITHGVLHEFVVPLTSTYNIATHSTGPAGIAISGDGTVWFAEAYGNSIGSYSNGQFHQFDLNKNGVNSPTGIAIDSHGNLWITQHGSSDISEFNPSSGLLASISTSVNGFTTSLPYFVQVDAHDNVWFNEHYGNAIARYTPSNGSLVEYEVPSRVADLGNISGVLTLALSSSGEPWFTELYTGKVGTVNTSSPVNVETRFAGQYGNTISIPSGSNASVVVSVSSETQVSLNSFVGSSDPSGFSFQFSKSDGAGNFSSVLVIGNKGASQGLYYVTVSAQSTEVIVDQVILVETT